HPFCFGAGTKRPGLCAMRTNAGAHSRKRILPPCAANSRSAAAKQGRKVPHGTPFALEQAREPVLRA
ncbi:MAG: hypothetical protein IKM42_07220, partial [Clostridia bacterium]|nr:hypothetical protein [Clostridia bacterium]